MRGSARPHPHPNPNPNPNPNPTPSNDEAGLLGGVLILAGLVGAAVCAVVLDTYHNYRTVLKVRPSTVYSVWCIVCGV